jgi:ribosomal protein L40E
MYDCNACKRPIVAPSAVASYESKYYHPDCLTCIKCHQSVSGKQFLKEKNGTLICETCNAKTAPKCFKCKEIFAPGESYKKLTDKIFYHNACFVCCGPCRDPIAAEFYDMENGKFICVDCYDKYGSDWDKVEDNNSAADEPPAYSAPAVPESNKPNLEEDFNNKMNMNPKRSNPYSEILPAVDRDELNSSASPTNYIKPKDNENSCEKCGEVLSGSFTVYDDKKYHAKCFTCCQCDQPFKEKTFYKLNGKALCRECHNHNQVSQASKCRKCSKPILETVVTFKNGEYHDYCLVCSNQSCSKTLIGQSIYCDKQDNPYCVDCFTKKESKTCGKCAKLIGPSQTNLVFEDKNFHKECFTCQECNRQIQSSESFYKSDDGKGIICPDCSN